MALAYPTALVCRTLDRMDKRMFVAVFAGAGCAVGVMLVALGLATRAGRERGGQERWGLTSSDITGLA